MTAIERKVAALEARHASQAEAHGGIAPREHVTKEDGTRWVRITYGDSVYELPDNGGDPVDEMFRRVEGGEPKPDDLTASADELWDLLKHVNDSV
ncbi:hypothetical protein [Candidatus Accumulibacter sp. ACC003]|uniref:hypothetical protein n=1 Tax=Candidatus Accumulibacter sp. ACC003 TaxID=2823334 RepID=UPI0025BCA3C7|nr:hypothetical protein [Candidatus Accumulibacter sp. ACC003]